MSNPNPPSPPTRQIRPTEERPTLGDLAEIGLLRELAKTSWEILDVLQLSRSQAPSPDRSPDPGEALLSTETPANPQAAPTTPRPPASPTEFELPDKFKSVQGDQDFEVLANGYAVPRYLIEVLNDFDKVAPGATRYEARPAVAAQMLIAYQARNHGSYPFCLNDDAAIPEKGSPCILKKGHRGRHKDNDDGSWP